MLFSGKRLTAAVTALVFTMTLTACGGNDDSTDIPEASPAPSEPASPTPTDTSSTLEKPTLPEATNDLAGQKAFAKYVVAAWAYGLGTNDFSAVAKVDPAGTCNGCKEMRGTLADRKSDGWHIEKPAVSVNSSDLVVKKGPLRVVGMEIATGRSQSVNDDGSVRKRNKPMTLYFEVGMVFKDDHFQITDYSVGD